MTLQIADKEGDNTISVITFVTDPKASIFYQVDGGDVQALTADNSGQQQVEVPKDPSIPLLVNAWARNTINDKYSSPTLSIKVPVKPIKWPAVQLLGTRKYTLPGESGSLLMFTPTELEMAEYDFQIRNWSNSYYGSPVTQIYDEKAKELGGFHIESTLYYSNPCSAELWISVKGKDSYIKVGYYSQTKGSTQAGVNSTARFTYDENYPGKRE